ncbi:MAG: DUF302 domain-containing protein [Trichlorobacter sp.]|jgi:uncharacterized protein (DUF302 family)|nr:DUF302 domain-containing protein [Trichlorobacter sp.]
MNDFAALFRAETSKTVKQFVADLTQNGQRKGFLIHNEDKMEMANTFGAHGVQVAEGFDLHMIQVCKPEKSAPSLQANPERAALIPKFITVFSDKGKTRVRMLRYLPALVNSLLSDPDFAVNVQGSYDAIEGIIKESL